MSLERSTYFDWAPLLRLLHAPYHVGAITGQNTVSRFVEQVRFIFYPHVAMCRNRLLGCGTRDQFAMLASQTPLRRASASMTTSSAAQGANSRTKACLRDD